MQTAPSVATRPAPSAPRRSGVARVTRAPARPARVARAVSTDNPKLVRGKEERPRDGSKKRAVLLAGKRAPRGRGWPAFACSRRGRVHSVERGTPVGGMWGGKRPTLRRPRAEDKPRAASETWGAQKTLPTTGRSRRHRVRRVRPRLPPPCHRPPPRSGGGVGVGRHFFLKALPRDVADRVDVTIISPATTFCTRRCCRPWATGTVEERSIVEPVR